jgi:hypothetical protein
MNWRTIAAPRNIILILILGLGLFLRLEGIQWGLPNPSHPYSYHPDESLILRHLSYMSPSSLNPHSFVNPSLHFYTFGIVYQGMRWTMGISSLKGTVPTHDLARIFLGGRILTAFMGVASIFFLYWIARRWYGEITALLRALFLTILPLHVVHSHYLTVEVPSSFWTLIAFIFFTRIEQTNRVRTYIGGGVASGFAAASKYTGILCVPVLLIGHLFIHRKKKMKALWDRKVIFYLIAAFLAFALGTPYFFLAPGEVYKDIRILLETNIHATKASYPFFSLLFYGFATPMLLGFLFGVIIAIYKRKAADIFLLAYIALAFLLIFYAGTPFSRHVVLAAPFMVLLAARSFSPLFERNFWKGYKKWIAGVLALLMVFICLWTFLYSLGYVRLMAGRDIRDTAAEWIDSQLPSGSSLGVSRPWFYTPPLNWPRYQIERVGFNTRNLVFSKPQYFLITDFEYREKAYIRRFFAQDYSDSERFVKMLEDPDLYQVKKVFEVTPGIAGFHFKKGYPPHDWMYIYPTIRLLERSSTINTDIKENE